MKHSTTLLTLHIVRSLCSSWASPFLVEASAFCFFQCSETDA